MQRFARSVLFIRSTHVWFCISHSCACRASPASSHGSSLSFTGICALFAPSNTTCLAFALWLRPQFSINVFSCALFALNNHVHALRPMSMRFLCAGQCHSAWCGSIRTFPTSCILGYHAQHMSRYAVGARQQPGCCHAFGALATPSACISGAHQAASGRARTYRHTQTSNTTRATRVRPVRLGEQTCCSG